MLRPFTGHIIGASLSDSFCISLRKSSTAAKPSGVPLATEWDGIDLLTVEQAPFASALAKSRPTARKGLNQLFINGRQNKATSTTASTTQTQNEAKARQATRIVATEASRVRPLNEKVSNTYQQDTRIRRATPNSSTEVSRQRPANGQRIYNRPTSAPSTERTGVNRALPQTENRPQRPLSRDDQERKNAARWNRMTLEGEAIGAAFIARPITIRNIPKFDALHSKETNVDYNKNKNRQMFATPRTFQGQNLKERRASNKTTTNPRRPSATVTAMTSRTNFVSETGARFTPTFHVTPLTDFNKLFYQSPFSDAAPSESEGKKQDTSIPPDLRVSSYDSYRDISESSIFPRSILPNARLLLSKQRDLGLLSRKKTLDIVEKFLQSENKPHVTV